MRAAAYRRESVSPAGKYGSPCYGASFFRTDSFWGVWDLSALRHGAEVEAVRLSVSTGGKGHYDLCAHTFCPGRH